MGRVGLVGRVGIVTLSLCFLSALHAQGTFESTVADLQSPDHGTRLAAVRALKDAAYPEAEEPVAALLADPFDDVQYEAIWTLLNIHLVEKAGRDQRAGPFVRRRDVIAAEPIFTAGPSALTGDPVSPAALDALLRATTDGNARAGAEALYAFGALSGPVAGAARANLRRRSRPGLAALLGATDPVLRWGAVRVIARVFGRLGAEPPVDPSMGDVVVAVLNDPEPAIARQAMDALGAMRYERAVQALTDLLTYYGQRDAGTGALAALARIAHPSSASVFHAMLADRSDERKRLGIEGLARLGDPAAQPAVDAALGGERGAELQLAGRFAAASLSGAALDPILDALADGRAHDQAYGYLVEIAAVRPAQLAGATRHTDPAVRAAVADALGDSRNPEALQTLAPLTGDADPGVAAAALRASKRLRADA